MVLEVAADAGQVADHGDGMLAQVIGIAEARDHEQLGRVDRPAAQDHPALGEGLANLAFAGIFDADGAVPSNSRRKARAFIARLRLARLSAGRR